MTNLSTIAQSTLIQGKHEIPILIGDELATGIRYDDVYISPHHIKFNEAFEGVTYRQRITIKNIGYKPAFIRIRQLNSIVNMIGIHPYAFQVEPLKSAILVSPGLSITTYVTYTFKRTSILHAIIPIEINGKIFDYCVISTLAAEYITIEPKTIDFGAIDIGYSSGLKLITIRNEGTKSTRFSIDVGKNNLDLIIKPLRGRIKPQKEMKLQLELMGVKEGIFYSEFWIKSIPNIRVPIKVCVIVPKLVIYHQNTIGDFTLIDFPPTVENTCRYDTFVLRNLSSRASSYVVLDEIDGGIKCVRDIDRKQYPANSVFEIYPLEGQINPFQGIIFEIKFSAISTSQRRREYEQKQQRKCENEYPSQMKNREFIQFIRIIRVHCTESKDIIRIEPIKDMNNALSHRISIQETTEISSMLMSCEASTDSGICNVIKLCLYGEVETVQLHLEPDTLYFGDLIVGQISQRVLRLTNPSAVVSIYLECAPNASARCCPNWMKLEPNTSIEAYIKVRGKESIKPSFKLFFNVVADSYESTASRRRFERIKVGSYFVECMVNIIFNSKKKEPLTKKSSSIKIIDDEEEIMGRLLCSPKWKLLYTDYSKIINKCARHVKSPLEKSISTTKTAVLIPLSPVQIYKVHICPTIFAFGMVASNSFNYRRLVVKNTNDVPVMIRLISSNKCVCFPEGNLMILQPDSIMTRLIEYFADGIGKFNGYINYVINNNHFFELSVTAHIVPKQLYIDKKKIEFGKEWLRREVYQPSASTIRIINKLDAKIRFRWEVPSGFYIEPRSGSVRRNATLHAYVRCESECNVMDNSYSVQAVMNCESGSHVFLRLSTLRFVPRVEFVSDHTNLGEIPLNLPTRVVAVLQNFEFTEVTYEINRKSLIRGCNVNPLRGKISPRGIAILEMYLTFDACCCFTTVIDVTVQGCLQLPYRINGSVSFPRLKLLPQRIDINRLRMNAFRTHQITAANVGTTLLKLQVLLEEYPEFHVSLSADDKGSEIDTEGITVAPGASQDLYLHFRPVDLASQAFYLPIVINQLLGPVSMLNPENVRPAELLKSHEAHYAHLPGFTMAPLPDKLPTVSINYTVAGHVVFFSKLSFRFNVATNELSEELFIENRATPREIAVSINIVEFNKADCPFAIEWSHGAAIRRSADSIGCTLCPGGSVSFVLEFRKPRKRGSFSAEAPIYVRGEHGVFNKLRLDGEFPASSIDVEPTEIYFTPVPVGTAIEEKFRIRARHFDNTAFIRPNFLTTPPPRCSGGDYKDELLRVEFPNGNVISPQSCVELEARVTFKSDQPISFCLTIEFSDEHALAAGFLTVYATADNNLLTTYMYSMKSGFDKTHGRYLEKRISYPSVLSDSATDEDDYDNEENLHARRHNESRLSVTSHFNNPSFIDKTTDSKLYRNREINDNGVGSENTQADGKWMLNGNGKRVKSIRKKPSFSMAFGARDPKLSERLSLTYPANGRKDDYEKYVERIITIAEEWMYSGPLKFRFYPSVLHGITAAFPYIRVEKKSHMENFKWENTTMPPFINVLESLVGPNIRTYLGELSKQPLPENDVERIDYVLRLYDEMLDFLLSRGACLIHVSSQFLLSYNDFLISIDVARDNAGRKGANCVARERPSRQLFESRSRQCWLDVILQTYKCLVLRGIHERKFWTVSPCTSRSVHAYRESILSSTSSFPKQYELHERAIRSIADSPGYGELAPDDGCAEERFLLAWLRYHYEEQRTRDWMTDRRVVLNLREKRDVAESRAVQNFHCDLSDSLVLIAVTVAYCPFLIDECFGNVYICPRNKQEVIPTLSRILANLVGKEKVPSFEDWNDNQDCALRLEIEN